MGWRRSLVTAAVALLACGTGFGVFGTSVANADDQPVTLAQARQQLNSLKQQVSDLQAQLDHSVDMMNQALVDQADLQTSIEEQQAKIDAMAPAFADMVNSGRQYNSLSNTVKFLLNDTPEQFLSHMDITAVVQNTMEEQMALLGSEKQKLADLNNELADAVKTAQDEVSAQQTILATQQAAQQKAQALVNKLSASQRAALGSAVVNLIGVKPQTQHVIEVILGLFPQIRIVGTMRDGTGSDHCYGLAADFMIPDYTNNVDLGWQIANYAKDHAKELNVKYIIWQQSIWQTMRPSKGWAHMASRGNDTANHYDHVHISLNA